MQDSSSFYDIFFIYHPEDLDFLRQLEAQLRMRDIRCRFDEEEFSGTSQGPQALLNGILHSHTVAIILSPDSAASQLCNELIEFSVTNSKRFVSLIIDENIKVDVHPAIAENAYVFFREEDDLESSIDSLLPFLAVDTHLKLHTELLVSANHWQQYQQLSDALLLPERVEEARQWLADGANRAPKPSELQVEFIHASRRQKAPQKRPKSRYVVLALLTIVVLVAIATTTNSLAASRAAAQATAAYASTSLAGTNIALAIAETATAESNSAARTLSNIAATSASRAQAFRQTVTSQAATATLQAEKTATQEALTAVYLANLRATEIFNLEKDTAAQAVIDGAAQALASGDQNLALALAWYAAQTFDHPGPALNLLREIDASSPLSVFQDISSLRVHPAGHQFALIPLSFDSVLVVDGESGALQYEITDHESDISALAYSRDGQFLVTGSLDGEVVIRDIADGSVLHRLAAHGGAVTAIAMNRSGDTMISAGTDPLLASWDLERGEELARYANDADDSTAALELLVTADDSRLIAWSNAGGKPVMAQYDAGSLELLTADTGGRVYLGHHENGRIAYSGGRTLPAYAGDPNTGDLSFWDLNTGQQIASLTEGFKWSLLSGGSIATATDSLEYIAFHEDNALLGARNSSGEHRAVLVNIVDGSPQRAFDGDIIASLASASFLDQQTILSATTDNRVIVWSTVTGSQIREIGRTPFTLARLDVAANGRFVLGQGADGTVYQWDVNGDSEGLINVFDNETDKVVVNQAGTALLITDERGTHLQRITGNETPLFSEDNKLTRTNEASSHFAIYSPQAINIYDALDGEHLAGWTIDIGDPSDIHMSPSGLRVILSATDETLWLLHPENDEPMQLSTGNAGPSTLVRFATDGSAFVTLHRERALLWQDGGAAPTQAFDLGLTPELAAQATVHIAFNPAGDQLLFFVRLGNGLGSLTRYALQDGTAQRHTFINVDRAELTADGKYLLLSQQNGRVLIIDAANGESLHQLDLGAAGIGKLAYSSRDGILLAAVNDSLQLWDIGSESLLRSFPHPEPVANFNFSSDGRHVVTVDDAGRYRLWQLEAHEQLMSRIAARFRPRELTCAEREQYLALPLCA